MKTIEWTGQAITKPGMYSKIALGTYHRSDICDGPSVSSSGLRRCFSMSPAHFYSEWSGNPNRKEPEDKQHFTVGRAVHHLLLGEPFFASQFVVQPSQWVDPDGVVNEWRKGKGGIKHADAWSTAREREGRAILKQADAESIVGMAESLAKHPIIQAGALNGMIERSIFFKDKASGLWVKTRPDAIPTTSVDFVDLKTTTSVMWLDLQKTIFDYGYHQQGALIRRAAREVLHLDNCTFTLVFVEKQAPFCVRVVTLKDPDLDRGDRANEHALDAIARCLKSGEWPGPGGDRRDAVGIDLPEWAQKQIDNRLEGEA